MDQSLLTHIAIVATQSSAETATKALNMVWRTRFTVGIISHGRGQSTVGECGWGDA